MLFFYAVVFVCACSVVRRWAEPSLSDNSIALIVLSIPLLAAALGRCDPGHILSNGVGLMIAVFLYASGSPRMWRLYCSAFIVAMIAIPGYTVYRGFLPRLGMAAMRDGRARDHARRQRPARVHRSVRHPPHAALCLQEQMALRAGEAQSSRCPRHDRLRLTLSWPRRLAPGRRNFEAPFGYRPNGFGSYHSSAVDYGYYEGIENANTPLAVQRKIDELMQHPDRDLLLPDASASLCSVNGLLQQQILTAFFFFPYLARVAHPVSVHQPLCDYIAGHYTLARSATADNFEYELWVPNKPSSASQ